MKINGERKYLWRTVDPDGTVLDILVQNRRDAAAARPFTWSRPQCLDPYGLVGQLAV